MDSTKQKVLSLIMEYPGKTAIELARSIFGEDAYQPRVNPSCVELMAEGKVERLGLGGRGDPYRYYPINRETIPTGNRETPALVELTSHEVKAARKFLNLSVREFAGMLDTDQSTIRKMEANERKSSYRPPAPRMSRLVRAYLSGYRPLDWPA